MKQLIVLVASVILGIGIGGIVLGFGSTAEEMGESASNGLSSIAEAVSGAAIHAQGIANSYTESLGN